MHRPAFPWKATFPVAFQASGTHFFSLGLLSYHTGSVVVAEAMIGRLVMTSLAIVLSSDAVSARPCSRQMAQDRI